MSKLLKKRLSDTSISNNDQDLLNTLHKRVRDSKDEIKQDGANNTLFPTVISDLHDIVQNELKGDFHAFVGDLIDNAHYKRNSRLLMRIKNRLEKYMKETHQHMSKSILNLLKYLEKHISKDIERFLTLQGVNNIFLLFEALRIVCYLCIRDIFSHFRRDEKAFSSFKSLSECSKETLEDIRTVLEVFILSQELLNGTLKRQWCINIDRINLNRPY